MRHCWISLLLPALLFAGTLSADEQKQEEPPWFEVEIIIFTRDFNRVSQSEAWPEYPGTPNFSGVRSLQPGTAPGIQPQGETSAEEEGDGEEVMPQLTTDQPMAEGTPGMTPPIPGATTIDASMMPTPTGQLDDGSTLDSATQMAGDESIIPEEAVPEGPQPPVPYALIPEEEYRLTSAFRRLQKTGHRLQPVVHLAWRQPVTDREQSERLYIRAVEETPDIPDATEIVNTQPAEPPELEGTLLVSVNRYLHVELDLLRYAKKAPTYSTVDGFPENGLIIETSAFNSYRMQSNRRMRSGELHYLDHPLMGALIKITPYELPEIIAEPVPEIVTESTVQPAPPTTGIVQPAAATDEPVEPTPLAPTANPQGEVKAR